MDSKQRREMIYLLLLQDKVEEAVNSLEGLYKDCEEQLGLDLRVYMHLIKKAVDRGCNIDYDSFIKKLSLEVDRLIASVGK